MQVSMNLSPNVRNALRQNPSFRHLLVLKRARQEGFRKAAARYLTWSQILEAPPSLVGSPGDGSQVEVHILCCWRDYLCAMWALKTFYRFSPKRYPLAIHIQGYSTRTMLRRLRTHFPGARIIVQKEADRAVKQWLSKYKLWRLLAIRKVNPFMLKLIDFPLFCDTPSMMILDSDVLFFQEPEELVSRSVAHRPFCFMRDCGDGYTISLDTARSEVGIPLAPAVNSGLAIVDRQSVDLRRCDELLSNPKIVSGNPAWLEQTLFALIASESNQLSYLSDAFLCSLERGRGFAGIAARHYAGNSRSLMTAEGISYLIEQGCLRAVRHV